LLTHRTVLLLLLAAACSSSPRAPSPDQPAPIPPDLTGSRVMVLPAQAAAGGRAGGEPVPGLDAEIAYWLADMGPRVTWVLPQQIQRALERSPSLDIKLDALAVSSFHRAEVVIIGDPLFGDLRALNVLLNARYALLPVAAGYVTRPAGPGRVEINIALIDTVGGRVLWFAAVAGDPGDESSPAVVASAARAFARAVLP
jgi:hypothetical protein